MNVKKTIKKIVALGTGATMVGATLMGATATLAEYPEPFVKDGVADVVLVVGAEARTSDTLGAIDIAASLQGSAVVPVKTSGGGSTQIIGDSVPIGQSNDLLEVGELIGDVKETLTDLDLDALQGGTITTDKGTTKYNQYLRFDDSQNAIASGTVVYEENEYDEIGDFLKFTSGDVMFEYHLEFEEGLESDIDSNLELEDLEDENIMIFGQDFSIVDTGLTTASNNTVIEMLGGDVVDTLEEGETKTYTIDGVDYEVTAIFISNPNSGSISAKLSVNGELTDELVEGETDILSNGLEIGIREILVNDRQGIVEFFLGANKLELTDGDCIDDTFSSAGLEVTSETIDDASIQIKCSYNSGSAPPTSGEELKISSIKLRLEADAAKGSDIFIPAGHGLREFLDEPQGMLNPTWDIRYEGLMDTGVSVLEFDPQGDHGYNLRFQNVEGLDYNIPLLENQESFQFGDKDADEKLWFIENCTGGVNDTTNTSNCYFISDDNYFVLTDDNDETGVTHVLRFDSVDSSDQVITFEDLATGDKTASYTGTATTAGSASGTLTVGGKDYDFFIFDDGTETFSLCMDVDNSGSCVDSGEANIVINGGGILDLMANQTNQTLTEDFRMELITLASEFDEDGRNNTGVNETINITIDMRTNNEIGLSLPSQDHVTLESDPDDSDFDRGLTFYGTFIELHDPSGADEAERLVFEYPLQQRGVEVFVTAGTISTVRTGGEGGAVAVNPVTVGLGVLDTEVQGQLGRQNMISIGGPCVNTISAELMGNPANCADGFEPGKAVIKMYEDQSALLVAGYSAQDTLGAAYVLADYEDYSLSGTEVEVVVADLDTITVNRVS